MAGDTIAAISTSLGEGGIGIVRMSGPEAISIAEKFFSPAKKTTRGGRSSFPSHRLVYGFIVDPCTGERVDEVLLAVMRAPRTYTREDVVEVNCHGGLLSMKKVLELALLHGARLAEPGEFTKRAFLNERIDLSQAEAAIDLIRARTEVAEKLALRQLGGALSERINALREKLLSISAHVEACLDFPEDDIEPRSLREMKDGIEVLADEIQDLLESFDEGKFFREGLRTAIVGKPNVGKSSLLNALLQRDRAIVTEMPGTTRDIIEEYLDIKGLPIVVMDTAGIREAHDMAEEEGVRRSMRAVEEADLVLGVVDGSQPLGDEDRTVIENLKGRSSILVVNKADLPQETGDASIFGLPLVHVSARTCEGLDSLRDAVYNSCIQSPSGLGEGIVVTNLRHRTALSASHTALTAALSALEDAPLEIVAMELREALDRLGEIVGAVTTEDVLNRIFSDFCIGK